MSVSLKLAYSIRGGRKEKQPGSYVAAKQIRLALARHDAIEWVLFWVFLAGLAWAPYARGSDDQMAWGINAMLFPGLAMIFELSIVAQAKSRPVPIRQLWASAALFAAVICWIVVQNATWTPLSWHHPIWAMASEALQKPVAGSVSVNRDLTMLALMRLVTAVSVFWLAVQLCRDSRRAQLFMSAIVTISVLYAAYGLVRFAFGSMSGVGLPSSRAFLTSTFGDPEPYAIYTGIGLVAVGSLIVRLYRNEVTTIGGSLRYRIASIIEATGQKGALLVGAGFLLLVSILLTGSREGITAVAFGMLVLAAVSLRWRKADLGGRRRTLILKALLFVMAISVAAYLVFGDPVIDTIGEDGISSDNRLAVYLITLRSIIDSPWLGYGYGTFVDVFGMFRDRSISTQGLWSNAHNTYLEVFQGLGLIAGLMLIVSIVLLVLRCVDNTVERHKAVAISSTAVSAAFLVGVNACADFSLQVPAVALTLMAIVGAGVAQSKSSRPTSNGSG